MRHHLRRAALLTFHGTACLLAIAIVPTLLYLKLQPPSLLAASA